MRKIILVLALIVPVFCMAQFQLTPDGFKTQDGKDFYVIKCDSMSKEDLFKTVEKNINKEYTNPKLVESSVSNESIAITAFSSYGVFIDAKRGFDVFYNLQFEFKDGKIKVNAPLISKMTGNKDRYLFINQKPSKFLGIYSVYKNSNLEYPLAKKSLEITFNSIINKLTNLSDSNW